MKEKTLLRLLPNTPCRACLVLISTYIYIYKWGLSCPNKKRGPSAHQKRLKLPILLAISPSFIYWHLWYCPYQFWPCGVVTQVRPLWYCFKPKPISAHCCFFFFYLATGPLLVIWHLWLCSCPFRPIVANVQNPPMISAFITIQDANSWWKKIK